MRLFSAALVGFALFATPALALTSGPQLAAQAGEAARALQSHATQAAATGKRMDLTTAPARDHVARVFSHQGLAALPESTADDVPWLIELLQSAATTNRTIILFGADAKQPRPETIALNTSQYEDEIVSAIIFQLRVFPRTVDALSDFMSRLPEKERNSPVRMDGAAKMIRGYLDAVQGALTFAAAKETKLSNVRIITTALSETIDTWSTFAEAEDRTRLTALIDGARTKPIDLKTDENLAAMASALKAAD